MKKFLIRFLPYLFLVASFYYLYEQMQVTSENLYYVDGNTKREPLPVEELKKDKYIICSDCGMMVKNPLTSAQVVTPSGRTYFFDDVGCMIRWVDRSGYKDKDLKMYVYVPECSCYIDAEDAWYVRDGITPIGYGVVAYGTSLGAASSDFTTSAFDYGYESFKEKADGEKPIYDFEEARKFVLRGETLLHPIVRKLILSGAIDKEDSEE